MTPIVLCVPERTQTHTCPSKCVGLVGERQSSTNNYTCGLTITAVTRDRKEIRRQGHTFTTKEKSKPWRGMEDKAGKGDWD